MVAIEVVECVGLAAAGADNCVAFDRPFPNILADHSAVDLDHGRSPTINEFVRPTKVRFPHTLH
jgi:hypothetical protein